MIHSVYRPSPEFSAQANISPAEYEDLLHQGTEGTVGFWERAAQRLTWDTHWDTAHTWKPADPASRTPPAATWFAGGRLNVAVNCVDRHVDSGHGDKVALYAEGEPGDRRTLTYADLRREVCQAANALLGLGIEKGDRVVIYLPVLAETIVITLACARIGAIHSLVFGGFSADAVRFRLQDTGAKLLVTSDGQFRRGKAVEVKTQADSAAAGLPHLEHVLVVRRTGQDIPWTPGRDVWWHESVGLASQEHRAEAFDSETPLFIIYTSGTTGKPKGLVHTMGGYLTQANWTHWAHFDVKDADVHWCTADLAWVTAHTYEIYGPLSNGVTQVIYEGTPDTPDRSRHLEIIERYGVSVYYTAPTLIRTLMSWFGDSLPTTHDISSLRLLGTVGEAINPEAWTWFYRNFGRGKCPIVDTWWQSETGASVCAPLPGVTPLKPGSATRPLPGLFATVVDEQGREITDGSTGSLVITRPWPAMARTIWRNPQRFYESYWSRYAEQGFYLAGDSARRDDDGYIWIQGRIDDVINVSGHRLSTIEIESELVAHSLVAEAGASGINDPLRGQSVVAFVVPNATPGAPTDCDSWCAQSEKYLAELREQVARGIGPVAKPADVVCVPEVPKTRSGKIMRRLLADLYEGRELGDVTSLQNPWAVEQITAILRHRASLSARPISDAHQPAGQLA